MTAILQEAAERQHNVIVRPRFPGVSLIQLDDKLLTPSRRKALLSPA